MKYSIEDYEETEFFSDDEEIINQKQKVVKVRKPHKCCTCENEILKGEHALRETGFIDNRPVSSYLCIACCDEWLDELNEHEEDEDYE